MDNQALTYEKRGAVSIVTLNRPDDCNAIDVQMAGELRKVFGDVRDDEDARALVLTGAHPKFSIGSGLDVRALIEKQTSFQDMREELRLHRAADELASMEIPTIAAINGDAIGQGFELALACDIRLASDTAKLGLDQIPNGLIPWDGGTQRLPRLVGRSVATSLIMLGELVDAREALRIGLVHQVFSHKELQQCALQLGEKISTYAPIALRYVKEAVSKGMDMTLDQALRLEQDLTLILQSTEDRDEGIRSFLEKKTPTFRGK